jgi:hypothetical protein
LNPEISVMQHGYMKGRSPTTNLVEFTNYVINENENDNQNGNQVDGV